MRGAYIETRVAVGARLDKVSHCKDLGIYLVACRKSLGEIHNLAYVSGRILEARTPIMKLLKVSR